MNQNTRTPATPGATSYLVDTFERADAWMDDVPADADPTARDLHKSFAAARAVHARVCCAQPVFAWEVAEAQRTVNRIPEAVDAWQRNRPAAASIGDLLATVAREERVLVATMAPDDYDHGQTRTVLPRAAKFTPPYCGREAGKYRVVSVPADWADWQRDRYLSGLHGAEVVTADAVLAHASK